ncbi:MAG: hypothetical protein CL764_01975 [Chloroflexi bacterium]|nr:hypothetical protein [Chloroflexota bacterium]|tara:strand:- start:2452 stop:2802 length:351 start_codon:yes stop_codon:yes gene_type:complete
MLKGIVVAFSIILISIPIPIVHFFTIPVSPFVAGFVGGGLSEADDEKVIYFGLIVAGLIAIPAFITGILALLSKVEIISLNVSLFYIVIAIIIVPYTWFGVTLGALGSWKLRKSSE